MTTKEEKCTLRKKVGAQIRAIRGKRTLAQYCALFNATPPAGITLAPSLLSRYERGLISCPGEKLCKMMDLREGEWRQFINGGAALAKQYKIKEGDK